MILAKELIAKKVDADWVKANTVTACLLYTSIDSLTFNRITSRGFDNLTEFQQAIIIDVCCDMAEDVYKRQM